MSKPSLVAELGEVMQIAFVPSDFEGTLKHWTETMGVGPFILLNGTRAEHSQFRGQDSNPTLDVALAQWGDMQIEVIRQVGNESSPYKEWRDEGREGVHHTCVIVKDIAKAKQTCLDAGMEILVEAGFQGTEWLYVDTGGGPGTILEIVSYADGGSGLMDMIKAAAKDWDGGDPVRPITLG